MDKQPKELPRGGFIAQLIGDVIIANQRMKTQDVQANRRDVVRTTFAAIEGLSWDLREHVRSGVSNLGDLTPLSDMALREESYTVDGKGDVVAQQRFIPLTTAIRLAVRQAQHSIPDLSVEFEHAGWAALQQAIKARNRVTHPKSIDDLTVTDDDLTALKRGLQWLLPTVEYIMRRMNLEMAIYTEQAQIWLERMKAGDPTALKEYYSELDRTGPDVN